MKMFTSCKEATRLVSEQVDHPLPLQKRILLKFHLMMCAHCTFFAKQVHGIKKMLGLFKKSEHEFLSPYTSSLSDEAKERIKSALQR